MAYAATVSVEIPFEQFIVLDCAEEPEGVYICTFIETFEPITSDDIRAEIIEALPDKDSSIEMPPEFPADRPRLTDKVIDDHPGILEFYTPREILISIIDDSVEDLKPICFNPKGALRENVIDWMEWGYTIYVKSPFGNENLRSDPDLKAEQLLSEVCKAKNTLDWKVNNPTRTHAGEEIVIPWAPNATISAEVIQTEEFSKRVISDRTTLVTIETAQEFICSTDLILMNGF